MNTTIRPPKFPLGKIFATSALLRELPDDVISGHSAELRECLDRHVSGDWGEVCAEDAASNDEALTIGARLLSAYHVTDRHGRPRKIWIITEADRSVTTILRPEDY